MELNKSLKQSNTKLYPFTLMYCFKFIEKKTEDQPYLVNCIKPMCQQITSAGLKPNTKYTNKITYTITIYFQLT